MQLQEVRARKEADEAAAEARAAQVLKQTLTVYSTLYFVVYH
jgi:hypothetical protein